MDNKIFNFIDNMESSLRKTANGEIAVVVRKAMEYQNKGFNEKETVELLIADDIDDNLAVKVAKHLYHNLPDDTEIRIASVQVPVAPASYDEIKVVIEKQLQQTPANVFVNKFQKLVPNLAPTKVNSFYNIINNAKKTNNFNIVHNELKPFIEDVMYENVVLAEKLKSKIKMAKKKNKMVVACNQEKNIVNLTDGKCTCSKYKDNFYNDFGLACEHIICAADTLNTNDEILVKTVII